jgi:diguanylate cyclase (GGDEF)-like protein
MAASIDTWDAYGALLRRLWPDVENTLITGADGHPIWASDAEVSPDLRATLAILASSGTNRQSDPDGLRDAHGKAPVRFGFRVRGALGEILGLVVIGMRADAATVAELAAVHLAIKPALDCLQRELAAQAAIGDLHADLADNSRHLELFKRLSYSGTDAPVAFGDIPALALEHLPGMLATIVVPERKLALYHPAPGQSRSMEAGVLLQLHRHLMTRSQLHGCTLVANRLVLDAGKDPLPYKAISTPIRDELRRVVGVVAVFRLDTDVDFQMRDAEVLELLARKATQITNSSFDFKTGLLTHAAFVAEAQLRLAGRAKPTAPFGLLYIDIDQLNVVNENHGMPVGDEVIREVAALLRRRCHDDILAGRLAGDRFAMLIPGCGIEPVARVAEELRSAAVMHSGVRGDKPLRVSLSIGVARVAESDPQLSQALAAAEYACRSAKERGRNRVEIFHGGAHFSQPVRRPTTLISQIAAALACDSLELLAQPIMPLAGMPADPRFEVLLRMRATDGTRLSYDKLMNTSLCPELATRIDKWVLERAFAQLDASRKVLGTHPARFSLNLSAASLVDPETWRMIEHLLRSTRIDPECIAFEFTEHAALGQIERIAPPMRRLRELGVHFTVENFGRGLGSLTHLRSLPVSSIKIDGAFSLELVDDPRSQSMVLATTKLAQTFELETIATQIETDAIRALVARLGVDFGQGFFIGKPLALDDVIADLPLYSCFATSTGLFDHVQVSGRMNH